MRLLKNAQAPMWQLLISISCMVCAIKIKYPIKKVFVLSAFLTDNLQNHTSAQRCTRITITLFMATHLHLKAKTK